MRDEGNLVPDDALPLAEGAVLYVLRRIKVDANLRWYMQHTEAFARLCSAEAERTGTNCDAVMEEYSKPADHCKDDKADVEILRAQVEDRDIENESLEMSLSDERRAAEEVASKWVDGDVPNWLAE